MSSAFLDFRQKKGLLVLGILFLGMALALIWSLGANWIWKKGYPESYVLGPPAIRFNDFTDVARAAVLPNPYVDPHALYPPTTFICLRALPSSDTFDWILLVFLSSILLALLIIRLGQSMVEGSWALVSLAFLFLLLSYPVLFCIDRGNIEMILVPLIGWAAYFYSRNRDMAGTLCLFPAICLKFYPAVFLILLLRRRKIGLVALCIGGVIAVTAASCFLFQDSPEAIWNSYRENLQFFREAILLSNESIEGSASLWNTYKILLLALEKIQLVPAINFDFDGPYIQASFLVYSIAFGIFTFICIGYVWLCEAKLSRGVGLLLLLVSISSPNGADYRLMYASLALVFLVSVRQRRWGDWSVLILVALAVIPKKEIFLAFAGGTETGYLDVSIQSVLNPVLIFAAIAILLGQAYRQLDGNRVFCRFQDINPLRWRF